MCQGWIACWKLPGQEAYKLLVALMFCLALPMYSFRNNCRLLSMEIVQTFTRGLLSVMKVLGAPMMYRYPYRTSAEGLHADWLNIGKDIESVMFKLEEYKTDEQRIDE